MMGMSWGIRLLVRSVVRGLAMAMEPKGMEPKGPQTFYCPKE